MRNASRYRSFFWPGLLILVGIIALLVNTGAIPVDRLYQLVNLWPLILIVIGLELIVRRSLHGATGDVAAALIVVLTVVGAVGYVALSPSAATHTMDTKGPVGNLEQASLEVNVGAANITLTGTTDVGSDLYRAHIEYSGPKPEVDFDHSTGKVTISQSSDGFLQAGKFTLNLQMNTGVPWTVSEDSGATTDTIDFSQLHIGSLTLNTGASRDEITLGTPSGTVPVEIDGGALTVHIHRPTSVATSMKVSGGAVTLTADGHESHAVGDLSYESGDFNAAADRYRVTIDGGACTITLDSSPIST